MFYNSIKDAQPATNNQFAFEDSFRQLLVETIKNFTERDEKFN